MSKKFKVGERARHLSGGPEMIVSSVLVNVDGDQTLVHLTWWDVQQHGFRKAELYAWELIKP